MNISHLLIEDCVRAALKEDLGHGHDITTQLLISNNAESTAAIKARKNGILAGLVPSLSAFTFTDPDFNIDIHKQDGDLLNIDDEIAIIEGPTQALLTAERTALNFLTHLSGIATLTAKYVDAIEGTNADIICTRKTIPGLRALQKYAVRIGGGSNHRHGLDDGILIKDNHIEAAGGIPESIDLAHNLSGHMVKIEVEVDTIEQLEIVLGCQGVYSVILDNMDIKTLVKAVKLIDGKIISQASGNIHLDNVRSIAETGVDLISVGALTHSAPALDIGLDIMMEN